MLYFHETQTAYFWIAGTVLSMDAFIVGMLFNEPIKSSLRSRLKATPYLFLKDTADLHIYSLVTFNILTVYKYIW